MYYMMAYILAMLIGYNLILILIVIFSEALGKMLHFHVLDSLFIVIN